MLLAPGDRREAEVQVAERAADGDVGQRQVDAHAIGLVAQALAHRRQRGVDAAHLPVDPGLRALRFAAPGPDLFHARQQGRVEHAVGQRLPGAHLDALAPAGRDQLAHRRQRVQVLDDDARVEHRLAAFHHQAGHLAQRVGLEHLVGGPHVFQRELEVELLLGHHDAHLAHVRAGERSDEFHVCRESGVQTILAKQVFGHGPRTRGRPQRLSARRCRPVDSGGPAGQIERRGRGR